MGSAILGSSCAISEAWRELVSADGNKERCAYKTWPGIWTFSPQIPQCLGEGSAEAGLAVDLEAAGHATVRVVAAGALMMAFVHIGFGLEPLVAAVRAHMDLQVELQIGIAKLGVVEESKVLMTAEEVRNVESQEPEHICLVVVHLREGHYMVMVLLE
jgi:hypothetical protein